MEEKIFTLRDHMEDHIIWINDLLMVLKILENGFEYDPVDKKSGKEVVNSRRLSEETGKGRKALR